MGISLKVLTQQNVKTLSPIFTVRHYVPHCVHPLYLEGSFGHQSRRCEALVLFKFAMRFFIPHWHITCRPVRGFFISEGGTEQDTVDVRLSRATSDPANKTY